MEQQQHLKKEDIQNSNSNKSASTIDILIEDIIRLKQIGNHLKERAYEGENGAMRMEQEQMLMANWT